ncbi:MAG: hypothetical protein ABL921_12275 [Pirellula sp.]
MNQASSSELQGLPDGVKQKLTDFRRRVRLVKIAEALLAGVFGLVAAYLLLLVADRFLDTHLLIRVGLLVAGMLGFTLYLPWMFQRWVWQTRRLENVARLLRFHFPRLSDQVLSVVELSTNNREQSRSPKLIAAAMSQVDKRMQGVDLALGVPWPRHRWWAIAATIPCVIAVAAFAMMPAVAWSTLQRFLFPSSNVHRYTFARLSALPDSIVIPFAEPFSVTAHSLENADWSPVSATAWVAGHRHSTHRTEAGSYPFELPGQMEPTELLIQAGDASVSTQLLPTPRPGLLKISANVTLPAYLQYSKPLDIEARNGGFSILKGSKFQCQARASRSIESASLNGVPMQVQADFIHSVPMEVQEPMDLQWTWRDQFGLEPSKPTRLRVRALEDQPPIVSCSNLSDQMILLSTELLKFDVSAEDDFGLKHIGLEWQGIADTLQNPEPAHGHRIAVSGSPEQRRLSGLSTLSCQAESILPQTLQLRAFAEDFMSGRGRVYSATYLVKVLSPDEHAKWIAEQMKRWTSKAEAVYDEELRLYEENRELRQLDPNQLRSAESSRRLQQQAAAERANAQKLESAVRDGRSLLEQAIRNEEIHAKQIEQWAEALQRLDRIAQEDMGSLAKKLDAVSQSKSPPAGSAKSNAGLSMDQSESSMEKAKSAPNANAQENGPNGSRLIIPETLLGSSDSNKTDSNTAKGSEGRDESKADSPMDQVVKDQAKIIEEFRRAREAFESLTTDFENSTFVKRFKAAARLQSEMATRLNGLIGSSFGLSPNEMSVQQRKDIGALAESQKAQSDILNAIQSDLEAVHNSTPSQNIEEILKEMKSLNTIIKLQEMPERLARNLRGDTLNRTEFWADTFDRWADELAGPANNGGGGGGDKEKDSMPPALLLEVMRIIGEEMDLRDETRTLRQVKTKDNVGSDEFSERATALAIHQMAIQERTLNAISDVRALPNSEKSFGEELAKMNKSVQAMDEASAVLSEWNVGDEAIAHETAAIEALLQTRRSKPGGDGSGSTGGGSMASGTTNRSPLEMLSPGRDESAKVIPRQVGEGSGKTGRVLPEEFREGLDAFFNALNTLQNKK